MSSPRINRRTLAKTAAWAAPAAALSVAAPAVAASPCQLRTLSWASFGTDSAGKLSGTRRSTIADVTATMNSGGNTAHSESLTLHLNHLRLRSNAPSPFQDHTTIGQSLSLRFDKPVQDLTFTVFDLDRHQSSSLVLRYEDRIHFSSTPPTSYTRGSQIVGDGRSGSWFRMNTEYSGGDMLGRPDQQDRDLYKVDLRWTSIPAGTTITMEYTQGDWYKLAPPTPSIWVSNPTFCA